MLRASFHDWTWASSREPPRVSPFGGAGTHKTTTQENLKPSRARHWDTRSCQMSVPRLKVPLVRGSLSWLVGSFTGHFKAPSRQAHGASGFAMLRLLASKLRLHPSSLKLPSNLERPPAGTEETMPRGGSTLSRPGPGANSSLCSASRIRCFSKAWLELGSTPLTTET